MFFKIVLVFSLLVFCGFKGPHASVVEEFEARASLGGLIDQVKQVITNLNDLSTGNIANALSTLTNLVKVVAAINQKFIDDGVSAIIDITNDVNVFINNVTQNAVNNGFDITTCTAGAIPELQDLQESLVRNVTTCITNETNNGLTMINDQIKAVNKVVAEITAAPLKLSKCLIALRPISCVTTLLQNYSDLLFNLPDQIESIVNNSTGYVKDLPSQLEGCIDTIVQPAVELSNTMINDIQTCVDKIIAQNSTTQAPTAFF